MELSLDKITKYVSAGLSVIVAIIFLVLGIKQKEIVLGIVWAAIVSALIWLVVYIVKRLVIYFGEKGSARRRLKQQAEAKQQ
jgi:hypothetical protein